VCVVDLLRVVLTVCVTDRESPAVTDVDDEYIALRVDVTETDSSCVSVIDRVDDRVRDPFTVNDTVAVVERDCSADGVSVSVDDLVRPCVTVALCDRTKVNESVLERVDDPDVDKDAGCDGVGLSDSCCVRVNDSEMSCDCVSVPLTDFCPENESVVVALMVCVSLIVVDPVEVKDNADVSLGDLVPLLLVVTNNVGETDIVSVRLRIAVCDTVDVTDVDFVGDTVRVASMDVV